MMSRDILYCCDILFVVTSNMDMTRNYMQVEQRKNYSGVRINLISSWLVVVQTVPVLLISKLILARSITKCKDPKDKKWVK